MRHDGCRKGKLAEMMPSMVVKHLHVLRKHLHDSLEDALIEGVGELLR